jgi:L-rhamnose isomerase/sugar isomerase
MPMRVTPPDIEAIEEPARAAHQRDLEYTGELVSRWGFSCSELVDEIARFQIAAPSWALGAGGTRFGTFPIAGEPRTTEEKIDDVAVLHALTGANGSVSLHVPWDDPPNPSALVEYAAELGLHFDAMNSNTFQDNPSTTRDGEISYKFGSMCHTDPRVRQLAVEHNKAVVEMGIALGSTAITVWLADGTNHPGQASLRGQFERVAGCLKELHDFLPKDWALYIEHKPYEPAFYSTVNADWGSSLLLAQAAGPRAKCLVDLGHHLPGCNIEQVVSRLAMVGRLGGFHFNDSKYGDDDLTVGSIQPYQLFLVMFELVEHGGGRMPDLAYMIDESHNLKDPIEDLIQATDQTQVALAQALLVKRDELHEAQQANDAARATEILQRAYRTDVRPVVAEARRRNGASLSPLSTYRALGYREAVVRERGASGGATGL